MGETILELQNIAKHFGDTDVLNGISISIGKGEFITLLGPSGCGKTTTLRIIAGLETPDEGRVILNGQDVTDSEPNKRDVNTVFQNYALFPHMTVAANIGYSLKLKKRPKDEIKKAVDDALALVQLSGYGKRMPAELSGGQRQRVAIARAVVNRPSVLLLDEPLGALDLQLRRQMQLELKALQKQLGITFIYITHDQEEALNMSDRIAVMKDGRFEQLGTPAEVYDSPLKLLYTYPAVVVGMVYALLQFMILAVYSSAEKMDWSLVEAARDLGATPLKAFLTVTLKLTLPGLLSGVILTFIPSMGLFFIADILGGNKVVLVGSLIQDQLMKAHNWPFAAALSVVLMILTSLMISLYKRVTHTTELEGIL